MASIGRTHRTLSQSVYDELRGRILNRDLKPGERLVERALAEELEVSRVPVREALGNLASEGLIEERPRIGWFVTEVPEAELNVLIDISNALSEVLFRYMRRNLDEQAKLRVEELFRRTDEAIAANETGRAVALNAKFHSLALEIAASEELEKLLLGLNVRLSWLMVQHADPVVFLEEHKRLFYSMCEDDDEQFEKQIQSHGALSRNTACSMR